MQNNTINNYTLFTSTILPVFTDVVLVAKDKIESNKLKKPFSLLFSKADAFLSKLYKEGVVDEEGRLKGKWQFKNLPALSLEENKQIIQKIQNYLHAKHHFCGREMNQYEDIPKAFPLEMDVKLFYLLKDLCAYSKEIAQINLIGGAAAWFLGKEYFYQAFQGLFGDILQKPKEWFNPDFQEECRLPPVDKDIRVHVAKPDAEKISKLANQTILLLANCINYRNFNSQVYLQHLKKKREYYNSLSGSQTAQIKKFSVQCFGLTKYFTTSEHSQNRYSILGLTSKTEDLDLMFVLDLKQNHLFSRDCLRIDFLNLVKEEKSPLLPIKCDPFNGAQVLCDRNARILYIHNFDQIDESFWLYFISYTSRYGYRLIQPKAEEKLAHAFTSYYSVALKKSVQKGNQALVEPAAYYAAAIKRSLISHHKTSFSIINYLFNASQSLLQQGVSDQEIFTMWEILYKDKLLSTQQLPPHFYVFVKRALLKDKIPFSELSSWIQLLALAFSPQSVTYHNNQYACILKMEGMSESYYLLLPFKPMEALNRVKMTLLPQVSQGSYSGSIFFELCRFFGNSKMEMSYPSPLEAHLEELPINPSILMKEAHEWISSSDSLTVYLGICLLFACPSVQLNDQMFFSLLRHLPKAMPVNNPEVFCSLLQKLKPIMTNPKLCNHHQAIETLFSFIQDKIQTKKTVSLEELTRYWIQGLSQSGQKELIWIAEQLFKNLYSGHEAEKELGLRLFQALTLKSPTEGITFLYRLERQYDLSARQLLSAFNTSCQHLKKITSFNLSTLSELESLGQKLLKAPLDKEKNLTFATSLIKILGPFLDHPETFSSFIKSITELLAAAKDDLLNINSISFNKCETAESFLHAFLLLKQYDLASHTLEKCLKLNWHKTQFKFLQTSLNCLEEFVHHQQWLPAAQGLKQIGYDYPALQIKKGSQTYQLVIQGLLNIAQAELATELLLNKKLISFFKIKSSTLSPLAVQAARKLVESAQEEGLKSALQLFAVYSLSKDRLWHDLAHEIFVSQNPILVQELKRHMHE
jgi:hypothetical protein